MCVFRIERQLIMFGKKIKKKSCQCLKIFSTYPDIYQNRQEIFWFQIISDVFEFILIDCFLDFSKFDHLPNVNNKLPMTK